METKPEYPRKTLIFSMLVEPSIIDETQRESYIIRNIEFIIDFCEYSP